jgi:poly-gamma-glutamate system protein
VRFTFSKRDRVLPKTRLNLIVTAAGLVSLGVYAFVQVYAPSRRLLYSHEMLEAARTMAKAVALIASHCDRSGIPIDEAIDPNRTGLVGPEHSELATALGHLEAKRTTTNPNMAGLVVHLLRQAGVGAGDSVAVGCSASFPGLMVATLAATRAMDVRPIVILSLGASSFGGTRMDFNLLDIYELLRREGVCPSPPAAVSLGGEQDIAAELTESSRYELIRKIEKSGAIFIYEPDLQKNVARRMRTYQESSGGAGISAFVNIGGSYANLGTSELALALQPGLNTRVEIPAKPERGVLFEMAASGVPCIHLLFIRGLAAKYGLPWDPVPLPAPGVFSPGK